MVNKKVTVIKDKIPKLRFAGFFGEWEVKRLGEVAKIITGQTPPTSNRSFYGGEFLFVSPADFNGQRCIGETKTTCTKAGFDKVRKVKKRSVLFVCIGSTIGKIAQASKSCITNQQINSLTANKVNSNDFLYFNLLNKVRRIRLLAGKQAVPMINKSDFSKIKSLFPTILEQQKIAEFLGAVDGWIENLRTQKENLESYKKGIMQKIFSQEVRFKNDDGNDFAEWEEKKLGEMDIFVSDGNYGEMYPKASEITNSGVPFIRANNINNLRIVWDDMKYIDKNLHDVLKSGHLKTGDILVTTRGDIGMLAYVEEEFNDSNINAQICLLRSGKNIFSKFLLNYLSSQIVQKQFKELQTGSALKQLPKGNLARVKIKFPSFPEQQKIAEFLTSINNLINSKQQQIIQAEQWKKGLMQNLFI